MHTHTCTRGGTEVAAGLLDDDLHGVEVLGRAALVRLVERQQVVARPRGDEAAQRSLVRAHFALRGLVEHLQIVHHPGVVDAGLGSHRVHGGLECLLQVAARLELDARVEAHHLEVMIPRQAGRGDLRWVRSHDAVNERVLVRARPAAPVVDQVGTQLRVGEQARRQHALQVAARLVLHQLDQICRAPTRCQARE